MAYKPEIRYVQFPIDGSAARELAPKKPLLIRFFPAKAPKKRVIKVDPLAWGAIAVSAVMLVLMVVGMVQLQQARQRVQTMENYVRTLTIENRVLDREYHAGYDLQEVEQFALYYGMVPVEQVEHRNMRVELPAQEEQLSFMDRAEEFFREKVADKVTGLLAALGE